MADRSRARIPRLQDRMSRDGARAVLSKTESLALTYAGRGGIHPLESVDRLNPRPGLRRWVAVNAATGERSVWKESGASIHHDGSVTLEGGDLSLLRRGRPLLPDSVHAASVRMRA
jgi:hypothetical protein